MFAMLMVRATTRKGENGQETQHEKQHEIVTTQIDKRAEIVLPRRFPLESYLERLQKEVLQYRVKSSTCGDLGLP